MVKPRLREHPEDINRRGRPPGSRNKMPQLLRSLVLTAATMSGKPTQKWIIQEALDSEGRVQWVEDTDPKTGEPITDKKTGKPVYRKKMWRHQVLEWTGAQGALGYMLFMAQEERNLFQGLLKLAQQQEDAKGDAVEGLQIPTLEDLREEWIRRGLRAVDFDKMKTVTGIEAKQRVKLIEYDPNEHRHGSKQQNSEATDTTDPESEQWWPDEDEDTEAED
jgi:hypothetical protein